MQNFKIIIYGAGKLCESTISYFQNISTILFIADEEVNKQGMQVKGVTVQLPESIHQTKYDLVVVAEDEYDNIKNDLSSRYQVDANKIVHYKDIIYLYDMNTGNMKPDWEDGITVNSLYKSIYERVSQEGNTLEKFFFLEKHRTLFKWLHYFEIYERHFEKYRNKEIVIMEIGVFGGGSLQMWKKYFGNKAKIIGIDIDPSCKNLEEEQIEIYIGDQSDKIFWKDIKEKVPHVDILIDDGGHYMEQQIITFEEMFDHVAEDGVYLCEDVHTSYLSEFGGGYKKKDSYIEYAKNFIDYIHGWFSEDNQLKVNEKTRSMHSLHYYTNIVVVEKSVMNRPLDMKISDLEDGRRIQFDIQKAINYICEEYEES